MVRFASSESATDRVIPETEPSVITNGSIQPLFSKGRTSSAIGPSELRASSQKMSEAAAVCPRLEISTRGM